MSACKNEKFEKKDLKRDLFILGASFTFTIVVAGLILIHNQSIKLESDEKILKLIQKLVDEKLETFPKLNNFYNRKSDYLHNDAEARSKRAIPDTQLPSPTGIVQL